MLWRPGVAALRVEVPSESQGCMGASGLPFVKAWTPIRTEVQGMVEWLMHAD